MEFTPEQKNEFLDSLVKSCQENIRTLEIQLLDSAQKLKAKEKYREKVLKRLEEKFYPTARDGKQDLKETEDHIENLKANVDRFLDGIAGEQKKIELIEQYRNQPEESQE